MIAYYNERDPKAAAWLRELINRGLIAPGVVDDRSIVDVRPGDLAGFTQCHFFAGIGVWSYALRLAGWSDSRPIWTGSCPCQPFSNAGGRAGFDDERHLWPHWFQLIAQCRPPVVVGEQVASKGGLHWFDLVHADLEAAEYAVGAADLCAAGVGAPHIRQRLWFVASLEDAEHGGRSAGLAHRPGAGAVVPRSAAGRLADDDRDGRGGSGSAWVHGRRAGEGGHEPAQGDADRAFGHDVDGRGAAGDLADDQRSGLQARAAGDVRGAVGHDEGGQPREPRQRRVRADDGLGTHWSDADWIYCRDDKWRPVEPGSFPLAHGAPARVGRLRGYGNAIVAQAAATFIEAAGLI